MAANSLQLFAGSGSSALFEPLKLESKLLKGAYIGYYIEYYYRGYRGRTRSVDSSALIVKHSLCIVGCLNRQMQY